MCSLSSSPQNSSYEQQQSPHRDQRVAIPTGTNGGQGKLLRTPCRLRRCQSRRRPRAVARRSGSRGTPRPRAGARRSAAAGGRRGRGRRGAAACVQANDIIVTEKPTTLQEGHGIPTRSTNYVLSCAWHAVSVVVYQIFCTDKQQ